MGSVTDSQHLKKGTDSTAVELATVASKASALVDDVNFGDIAGEFSPIGKDTLPLPSTNNSNNHDRYIHKVAPLPTNRPCSPLRSGLDIKPPSRQPHPPPLITGQKIRVDQEHGQDRHEDTLSSSPALAKFAIMPREADPERTLPAMQKSPPPSASTLSPDSAQSLPSLQTALSQLNGSPGVNCISGSGQVAPLSGQSPPVTRRSPFHMQQNGPSPRIYTHQSPGISPSGLSSHNGYWRPTPNDGSSFTPTSYESSTPSSYAGPSPATSYPTPIVQDHRITLDASLKTQLVNGVLPACGPFVSSDFRCTHPGCTAAPFQTQYLLNSHANVHSSNRPHYCPIPTCARSEGGKGFKRKNEMIRHGLVHQSPGYKW